MTAGANHPSFTAPERRPPCAALAVTSQAGEPPRPATAAPPSLPPTKRGGSARPVGTRPPRLAHATFAGPPASLLDKIQQRQADIERLIQARSFDAIQELARTERTVVPKAEAALVTAQAKAATLRRSRLGDTPSGSDMAGEPLTSLAEGPTAMDLFASAGAEPPAAPPGRGGARVTGSPRGGRAAVTGGAKRQVKTFVGLNFCR